MSQYSLGFRVCRFPRTNCVRQLAACFFRPMKTKVNVVVVSLVCHHLMQSVLYDVILVFVADIVVPCNQQPCCVDSSAIIGVHKHFTYNEAHLDSQALAAWDACGRQT